MANWTILSDDFPCELPCECNFECLIYDIFFSFLIPSSILPSDTEKSSFPKDIHLLIMKLSLNSQIDLQKGQFYVEHVQIQSVPQI